MGWSAAGWLWEHAEHKTLKYRCILSQRKKSEVIWASENDFRALGSWRKWSYWRIPLCFLSKVNIGIGKMGFPQSPRDIPMNCILHQESLGDHKTRFSRKQNYEKLDLESFELEHHWISSYARSSHQLNRPDLPNVSNLVSLGNQVQVLKSIRIFSLA